MSKDRSLSTCDSGTLPGGSIMLDLIRTDLPRWQIYALAIGMSLAFLALRTAMAVSFGDRPLLIIFMFPIILSALLGGLGPGVAATVTAAIGIDYLAIPPQGSLMIGKTHDLVQWLFLLSNGVLVSALSETLHRTRHTALTHWRQARSAQEALSESERRFRSTFDQAAVGIALVAPDGRWLMVNQKLCDIVGYGWDELQSLGFQDITHPDDLNADLAYVEKMLAGEIATYTMEKRYLRKAGGTVWVNLTVALVRDETGAPDYFISVIEDIQLRKQAEESLHKAEAWFRAVIDSSDDAIVGKDLDGRITSWNPAAERIFGYTAQEAIGRSVGMLYPPGQANGEASLLEKIGHGERLSHYEAERVRKDGRTLIASISVSPIRDESGRLIGASKIARDITAQKQAEKALRDSAIALNEAQKLASVGSWEWDVGTGRHTWSEEVFRIYGRPTDLPPAIYPEVAQYFTPESWARLSAEVEQGLAQGDSYTCDAEVVRPDGVHRWIVARGEATRDADGKVVNLHGTVQDITERKQAELALRESEERLQLFVEHAPASLAMFDREMRYLAVSRRWLDDYRLGGRDIIGQSHYQIFPEIPDSWREIHRRGLAGEVVKADEDRFEREDGSVQWLRWEVRPWHRSDGEVGGIVLFSEDITHAKEAEIEIRRLNADLEQSVLERTAELTAANTELDSFAYAVSHDLRAPLRAMNGFSQALQEDYGAKLDGEAKLYLDQIGIASQKMSDLIDGLLTLSRSTRTQLEREPVDITALAGRILVELAETEPARKLNWRVEPGLSVQGDSRMVGVVMQNLLDNAWKYTAKTAKAEIKVYAEENGRGRQVCVADNGAGFDMGHAEKLFQPFQRLHRQEEFTGIGIGLATVQRIVRRHGGMIEAEGAPGRGARFCFTLADPAATEQERV